MNKRINTPWGVSDDAGTVIAPGIISYTTPSHGGFHLSKDRLAQMPAELRAIEPFTGRAGWYEEDCDWVIVVLAFPDCFPPNHVYHAIDFVERGYANWQHALACRNWLNLNDEAERTLNRAREAA